MEPRGRCRAAWPTEIVTTPSLNFQTSCFSCWGRDRWLNSCCPQVTDSAATLSLTLEWAGRTLMTPSGKFLHRYLKRWEVLSHPKYFYGFFQFPLRWLLKCISNSLKTLSLRNTCKSPLVFLLLGPEDVRAAPRLRQQITAEIPTSPF